MFMPSILSISSIYGEILYNVANFAISVSLNYAIFISLPHNRASYVTFLREFKLCCCRQMINRQLAFYGENEEGKEKDMRLRNETEIAVNY